jgi:hypothetical protein
MLGDIALTGSGYVLACGGILLAFRYLVHRVSNSKLVRIQTRSQSRYAIERMQIHRLDR